MFLVVWKKLVCQLAVTAAGFTVAYMMLVTSTCTVLTVANMMLVKSLLLLT